MILAIMIGRKGSKGFPNKNIKKIFGKSVCEYPIIAAKKSKKINKIFVSTDCNNIKKISKKYQVQFIPRPKNLNTDKALGDHVFLHCAKFLQKKYGKIKFFVLLMANSPTLSSKILDQAIKKLERNKNADSIVSVSKYNMWSPIRARKINDSGFLDPFIKFEKMFSKGLKNINCDRDSQGNVYFADMSFSIVRPKCFDNMKNNLLPQKWMGKKILPFENDYGLDIDFKWQMPQAEYWINKNVKRK